MVTLVEGERRSGSDQGGGRGRPLVSQFPGRSTALNADQNEEHQ